MNKAVRRSLGSPAVFMLPGLLFLLLFAIYPLFLTLVNSFRRVTVPGLVTGDMPFIGLENYGKVVSDPLFFASLGRTLLFTVVCVAVQFLLGLILAVLLNRKFVGRGILRMLMMVPWVLPIVVIGATFKWMFQTGNGLINTILKMTGLSAVPWLEQPNTAFAAIILANIWLGFPFAMQNLSAALQTVPTSVLEAAQVDGTNAWQRFTRVTLPVIRGPIVILITLQVIYTFNVFELILVMTGGGPAGGTTVVTYYAYQQGFEFFNLGPASAAVVLLMIGLGAFSSLYVWLTARSENN